MLKLLYTLTSEKTESSSTREIIFTNKEIYFNTPEEAIRFINNEYTRPIPFNDVNAGGSIWNMINTVIA